MARVIIKWDAEAVCRGGHKASVPGHKWDAEAVCRGGHKASVHEAVKD